MFRIRFISVLMLALALVALPLTAEATGSSSRGGVAWGKSVLVGETIYGEGTYIDYASISAVKSAGQADLDFPNFVGCYVHAQLYNESPHYRSWNSDSVSCSTFVNNGARFIISVNDYVPEATYYATLWIDNNGSDAQHGGVPGIDVY